MYAFASNNYGLGITSCIPILKKESVSQIDPEFYAALCIDIMASGPLSEYFSFDSEDEFATFFLFDSDEAFESIYGIMDSKFKTVTEE